MLPGQPHTQLQGSQKLPYLARRVACSSCSLAASREVSRRRVRPSTPSACSLLSSKGGDCRAADAAAASGAERMVWREGENE